MSKERETVMEYCRNFKECYKKAEALMFANKKSDAITVMTPCLLMWLEIKHLAMELEDKEHDEEMYEAMADVHELIYDYQDMMGVQTIIIDDAPIVQAETLNLKISPVTKTNKEDTMSKEENKKEEPKLEIVNEETNSVEEETKSSKVKETYTTVKQFVVNQKDCYKKSWFKYACGAVACVICFFIGIMVGRD